MPGNQPGGREASVNPFTWDDSHLLGLREIDDEHKALFKIGEQIYNEVTDGTAKDGLGATLARLGAYAKFHFEIEEKLMQRTDFLVLRNTARNTSVSSPK
jgi:hemerythrin-like metal-binding protein